MTRTNILTIGGLKLVWLQIFRNTIMTGLIHKTITKVAITKLFGLRHLQLVKKRWASGRADKKVDVLTSTTFLLLFLDNLVPRPLGLQF